MRKPVFLLALAVVACAGACGSEPGGQGRPEAAPGLTDRDAARLLARLRGGGHHVVFRHAATDSGVDMTDDLRDCSRQRNLSREGREESRAVGLAFRRLRIPVGRVLASPFCRTRDTARLGFGRVRGSRALLSAEFFENARAARRRGLRRVLSAEPRDGTNTILVTHGSAIDGTAGVNPEEGGAVVVAPRSGGRGFDVVETVAPGGWRELARP